MKSMTVILLVALLALKPQSRQIEVQATPFIPPQLQFSLEAGNVSKDRPLVCTSKHEHRQYADHNDTYLILECNDGIKLKLDNATFAEGQKIALKIDEVRR
jgi:hypothetical protein